MWIRSRATQSPPEQFSIDERIEERRCRPARAGPNQTCLSQSCSSSARAEPASPRPNILRSRSKFPLVPTPQAIRDHRRPVCQSHSACPSPHESRSLLENSSMASGFSGGVLRPQQCLRHGEAHTRCEVMRRGRRTPGNVSPRARRHPGSAINAQENRRSENCYPEGQRGTDPMWPV